jgi:hypothetical protein
MRQGGAERTDKVERTKRTKQGAKIRDQRAVSREQRAETSTQWTTIREQ